MDYFGYSSRQVSHFRFLGKEINPVHFRLPSPIDLAIEQQNYLGPPVKEKAPQIPAGLAWQSLNGSSV